MQKSLEFCMRWMGYVEILTRARARKGEAQGVLTYQKVTGIFDNPHIFNSYIEFIYCFYISFLYSINILK